MTTKRYAYGIILFVCIILSACEPDRYIPENGVWYCEELKAQLVFSDPPDDWDPVNNDESGIYIMEGDDKIACDWSNNPGSRYFNIVCYETDHPKYPVGRVLYQFEVVQLTDSLFVLKDRKNDKEYSFIKTADQFEWHSSTEGGSVVSSESE